MDKTSPRDGEQKSPLTTAAEKMKLVRASSEVKDRTSPRDRHDHLTQSADHKMDPSKRKSAFGIRMSSAPAKKSSLADIFFMSSPLHGHAKRGDVAEIVKMVGVRKNALSEKEYVDWLNSHVNKNEQSALHVAVQHNHTEAALKLTELGSSLNLKDVNGRTPLLYAARYGNMDLLKYFWEKTEKPLEESDNQGDSALHLAAIHGHMNVLKYILDNGKGNINVINKFGETALHKAARTDNLQMVNVLLELGADPNVMGRDGKARHVATSEVVAQRLRSSTPTGLTGASPHVVDVDKLLAEDEDEDDSDDVQFMIPGVRKIIEGVHGASPDSELVHFKLRRAMKKSGIGSVPSLSDEQLFTQHEVRRKQSIASGNIPSEGSASLSGELSSPSESSGVQIEISLPSGVAPKPGSLSYLFEPYRGIFGKPHHNYVCRTFGSQQGPQTVIATVLASPEGHVYPGLMRWSNGYSSFTLSADEIKSEEKVETFSLVCSCWLLLKKMRKDLPEAIRCALERGLLSADDLLSSVVSPSTLRKPTLTPKTRRISIMIKHPVQQWRLADEVALKTELLALELKLGLPRQISVGVIMFQPGQDEAQAAASSIMSKPLELFMASIAAPTESLGWSGYSGGLSTKESTKFYYCGWRGLEIVFHVAPLMSEAQRRQFIGNDKVLIYFLDGWRPGAQLDPKFRGQVNSTAICVNPIAANFYKFSAFHRIGMNDSRPSFGEDPVELTSVTKEVLMNKIVNAHVDSYNLLYSERMQRAWKEELSSIADRYDKKKKTSKKK